MKKLILIILIVALFYPIQKIESFNKSFFIGALIKGVEIALIVLVSKNVSDNKN